MHKELPKHVINSPANWWPSNQCPLKDQFNCRAKFSYTFEIFDVEFLSSKLIGKSSLEVLQQLCVD